MVTVCDLCGTRMPEQTRREWFVGIDGTLFTFACEQGDPIDTCSECHKVVRDEVMHRLACARERRSIERGRLGA